MGVPGFFLWLWKKYKSKNFVFSKSDTQLINTDYFLLDMNCMIHPVCFETLKELHINENVDVDRLENKMINNVIIYLEKLIELAEPKKCIYLAIDGVAPVAKMKQQRLRRYKSINDKKVFDNIRKKHKKDIPYFWNNSAITPGTNFMSKLTDKLKVWSLNYSDKTKLEIILSPSNVPAEGEHKILQYIRNSINNTLYTYVIYGLDADLIFLMLSLSSSGIENIYLMREAQQMENKAQKDAINFVSIKIMKDCIFDSIQNIMSKNEHPIILDKNKVIDDFIFICCLMGNDFLPHIPALDIYSNAIDKLLECYVDTLLLSGYIMNNNNINNINININNFYSFIIKLASDEEQSIMKTYGSTKGYKKKYPCQSTDPFDIEMHKIETVSFKINDPIRLGEGPMIDWRERFYNHYYNVTNDELDEFSDKMVYHYNVGLKWVAMYYFDKCPSWDWYYPYDHAPFLTEMAKNKFDFDSIIFKESIPLTSYEQLLIVLPKATSYLLPVELRKIMTNINGSASHLYPDKFELDMIGKKKYWMCNPILPNLEINLIKKMFEKYNNLLNETSKNNNKIGNILIF
jgi:5'-3' exonuclease